MSKYSSFKEHQLITENWRRFLTEQNIAYSGIVLDEESRQKLLELPMPKGWEPVAHHMTITMGPLQHPKGKHDFSKTYPVGSPVKLTAIAVGQDDRAMAVKISPPGKINPKISFPHITMAVNREGGGKPFHSNKIPKENFTDLPKGEIPLEGTVEEISQ